jgi:hypothetical protein
MPVMTSVPRKGRRDIEPANCLNETGIECDKVQAQELRMDWAATVMSPCGVINCKVPGPSGPLLTNRMREFFTYGSVGGVGGNPGSYPAANAGGARRLHNRALRAARITQFRRYSCSQAANEPIL